MKVRIGKNIHFNWTVTYNDEVIDLSTHGVEVEITTPKRTKIIVTPDINYNVLSFDYKGKTIGAHYLTCYVDRYTINETVCDLKEPFYLVEKSWMEEDEEPSELQTETINIDGNVTIGGGVTYTAGNGIDITGDTISIDTDVVATKSDLESKQDTLTAGTNITIDANNVISASGSSYTAGDGIDITNDTISIDTDVVATQNDLSGKQNTLTAGANITITNNEISATDTVYTAGAGIDIVNNDTITIDANVVATKSDLDDKQDTLTAGSNINIDANNVISANDTTYTAGNGIDITNDVISVITPEPEPDYATMPLTIDIYENDTVFNYTYAGSELLYFSYNGGEWQSLEPSIQGATYSRIVHQGDTLALKMDRTTNYVDNVLVILNFSKTFGAKGNAMSMLFGDNFIGQTDLTGYNYGLANLFAGSPIVDADRLLLPATTLSNYCYKAMFNSCTSLTKAPELPATTLSSNCYSFMFNACYHLTKAPKLPATTLADYCYSEMFRYCSLLTEPPELPATTLAGGCYQRMFFDCTSLTKAPELPATTLASTCYSGMFSGCTSLTKAPELPATTLRNSCYYGMFSDCTSLTKAPELPDAMISDTCYRSMFQGCSSLNYIKCLVTNSNFSNVADFWVSGVAATGTFIKNPEATWTATGISGVPTGWTLEYATPDTIIKEVNTSNLPVTSAAIKNYVDQHSGSSGGSSYTAGNGIDITNDTISVDTNVIATQADLANCLTKPSDSSSIVNANYSISGYAGYAKEGFNKTSTSTANLPSACSYDTEHGTTSYPGQWGVLLVILQNATNATGSQLFFCAGGSQAGTIWVRSSEQGAYTTWQKITTTT